MAERRERRQLRKQIRVDVATTDTPALPVVGELQGIKAADDESVESIETAGQHEQQSDSQRRSRRTPRSQRIEGQRRKRINEEARNQREEAQPAAPVQLTTAAQADAAKAKDDEPVNPVVTSPCADAVAAALQASASLTEHAVTDAISEEATKQVTTDENVVMTQPAATASPVDEVMVAAQPEAIIVADPVADVVAVTVVETAPVVEVTAATPIAEIAPAAVSEMPAPAAVLETSATAVVLEDAPVITKQLVHSAGLMARARKAYAPMATPAEAPALPVREPVNYPPLVRGEVISSGRHGGSTAAVNTASCPAGRP